MSTDIRKKIISYNDFKTLCSTNISKDFLKVQADVISDHLIRLLFSKKSDKQIIIWVIIFVHDSIKQKYIDNMSYKYIIKFVKNALSFDDSVINFDTYSQDGLTNQLVEAKLIDFDAVKKTIKELSKKELCMIISYIYNNNFIPDLY